MLNIAIFSNICIRYWEQKTTYGSGTNKIWYRLWDVFIELWTFVIGMVYDYRVGLEPPLLQQAAFNDVVYAVDVMRGVASRTVQPTDTIRRTSLPVSLLLPSLTSSSPMYYWVEWMNTRLVVFSLPYLLLKDILPFGFLYFHEHKVH